MKDKEKQISMKEMLTKRSFETITICNCRKDKDSAFADLLNQEIEELQKAKAIEEMARELCPYGANKDYYRSCEICKSALMTGCDVFNKAKKLYNKILPKDSVVLSKKEYENIYEQAEQNVLANIADGGTSCHWCIEQHEKIGYRKGSKETAEKIIVDLIARAKQKQEEYKDMSYKSIGYNPNIGKSISAEWYLFEKYLRNILAKQFGVEIKE